MIDQQPEQIAPDAPETVNRYSYFHCLEERKKTASLKDRFAERVKESYLSFNAVILALSV